jgi:hypothetical protein
VSQKFLLYTNIAIGGIIMIIIKIMEIVIFSVIFVQLATLIHESAHALSALILT